MSSGQEEICRGRYCPVGTVIDGRTFESDPTRGVEETYVSPSKAPDAMDKMKLRDGMIHRRRDGRDHMAKSKKGKSPVVASSNRVQSDSGRLAQIQLMLLLPQYRDAGIQYATLSQYFESSIAQLDVAREYANILRHILVKSRSELQDSNACYAAVLSSVQNGSIFGLEFISDSIRQLGDTLKIIK